MRKNKSSNKIDFSILAIDDDPIMTSTLQAYFERSGYQVDTENNPQKAVERVRTGRYDILLLDFLMTPICGDQVVREIRQFNRDIFIILLTGHKSMAPPIRTIRQLDIQGYFEKSDRFDQLELLVESCVKSIQQMRTIQNYQNGLSAIMDALPQVYHLQSFESMVEDILQALHYLFSAENVFLELKKDRHEENIASISPCFWSHGTVLQEEVDSLLKLKNQETEKGEVIDAEYLLAAPLMNGQLPIGYLGFRSEKTPSYEQTQLLQVFARQVSAAIGNSRLHTLVNRKKEELDQAYQRLRDSYMEIVGALRLVVDAKDIYTRGHSDRVSALACNIAHAMKMDNEFCERVRIAGQFHDIGKISVPDHILLKPGKLTQQEYEIIQRHSADGAKLLSAITMFHDIVPAVRSHHERMDGRGYPDGLKGDRIPLEARVIAVADCFDAMTSDRQYRKGLSQKEAINELIKGKNSQFDPNVVDAFLEITEL